MGYQIGVSIKLRGSGKQWSLQKNLEEESNSWPSQRGSITESRIQFQISSLKFRFLYLNTWKHVRNIYASDIRSVNDPGPFESDTLLRIWYTTTPQITLNSHCSHWNPKVHFNWLNIPIVSAFQLLSTIRYFHSSWGECESHTGIICQVGWRPCTISNVTRQLCG